MLAELIQNIFDNKKKKKPVAQPAPTTQPLVPRDPKRFADIPSQQFGLGPEEYNRAMVPQIPESPERDEYEAAQQYKAVVPQVVPQLSPTQNTQAQIQAIQDKQYGPGGKDRDPKWSTGEKVLSFFRGMFNGDGAINAAMDRNYGEKYADRQELGRLVPQLKQQQQAQDYENDQSYRQAQIKNAELKPEQIERELEVKEYKILADNAYKNDLLMFKREVADANKADRDRIYELKKQGVAQQDARIKLLEEGIKSREKMNTENNQTRKEIAGIQEQGKMTRARDTRNFNAEQKQIERKLRVAMQQYKVAKDHEKAYRLEEIRVLREQARKAGIE